MLISNKKLYKWGFLLPSPSELRRRHQPHGIFSEWGAGHATTTRAILRTECVLLRSLLWAVYYFPVLKIMEMHLILPNALYFFPGCHCLFWATSGNKKVKIHLFFRRGDCMCISKSDHSDVPFLSASLPCSLSLWALTAAWLATMQRAMTPQAWCMWLSCCSQLNSCSQSYSLAKRVCLLRWAQSF